MLLEYRQRSNDELKELFGQMQRGIVVSSLQLRFVNVEPGSEAHTTMLSRTITQMFPAIQHATQDERALMLEHRAAVYYERADRSQVEDGDGIPVFSTVEWLSETDFRRMWTLAGSILRLDELPQIETSGEAQSG